MTAKQLEEMGYNVAVYPIWTRYAAAWSVKHAMQKRITTGATSKFMDNNDNFLGFQ